MTTIHSDRTVSDKNNPFRCASNIKARTEKEATDDSTQTERERMREI